MGRFVGDLGDLRSVLHAGIREASWRGGGSDSSAAHATLIDDLHRNA